MAASCVNMLFFSYLKPCAILSQITIGDDARRREACRRPIFAPYLESLASRLAALFAQA